MIPPPDEYNPYQDILDGAADPQGVAIHESAHVIVGRLHGVMPRLVCMNPSRQDGIDTAAHVLYWDDAWGYTLKGWLACARTSLAGVAANIILNRPSSLGGDMKNAMSELQGYALLRRGVRVDSERGRALRAGGLRRHERRIFSALSGETLRMVHENWKLICRLARAFEHGGVFIESQIEEIIQQGTAYDE